MEEKGSGWRFFAGTVLGIAGIMRFFDAIWAWRYHGAVPDRLEGALFGRSLSTYGWVYFIVALILIGSSFGVLSGSQFSRWIGIIAGGVLAISAVWWLPYYPVWSLLYIAMGILVIYGLVVYGGRQPADEARGV
jgi:cellulose synthase/poly-beta-1,6-N-acetylglucosamine synthase-like glycosyltransferase